ncbi:MAG: NAD(P)-binding domain-containing protein [Acidobacteriota bacterium]
MEQRRETAIIGVGAVGAGFGHRLAETGQRVVFGVRPGRDVSELLDTIGSRARATSVPDAVAAADVVVLAVPAEAAVASLDGAVLDGKIVIDATNPLSFDGAVRWAPPAEGSMTAHLAAVRPEARWVKALATFGADHHRDPQRHGAPIDAHLAGDDEKAKQHVAAILESAGFGPLDCGPLDLAGALENLAVLWIELAQRHGRQIAFQLVGR